jgi:hypothetical protein
MITFNTTIETGKLITEYLINHNYHHNIDFTNILSEDKQIFIFTNTKLELFIQLTFSEYL